MNPIGETCKETVSQGGGKSGGQNLTASAANIFGEHDFYNDKSRNGSVTIQPGDSLRFRYRVVIHPGDSQTANIAAMYKKYTEGK